MSSNLPPGWEWTTVSDVAEVQLGRQRSPQHHSGSQMRPYLRSANVTWDGINLDDVKEMNFDDAEFKNYRLRRGDLLLNEASGSPNEVGKPALWNGEIEGCCFQNTLLRLRPYEIGRAYLYWYCSLSARTGRFGDAGRGVNIRHLGKQGLSRFPIPIAPMAEQKRIVDAIEEHFSRLDATEATLRQTLKRLDTLRSSVLADAFHANRELPSGWMTAHLSDLLDHSIGGLWGRPAGEDAHDVSVIRVTELQDHGSLTMSTAAKRSITSRQLQTRLLRPGDLVLEKSGGGPTTPVGRVARFAGHTDDAICTNFMQLMRPNADVIDSGFLHWQLHHRYVSGATAPLNKGSGNIRNLQTKDYLRQLVAVPQRHEQGRIASRLERDFVQARELESGLKASLERVAALRQSILAAAFSGRLVAQDPDGEPASVLLERITASRPAQSTRRRAHS